MLQVKFLGSVCTLQEVYQEQERCVYSIHQTFSRYFTVGDWLAKLEFNRHQTHASLP